MGIRQGANDRHIQGAWRQRLIQGGKWRVSVVLGNALREIRV